MLKRMNLCNFVTRGARNGGITALPTCCRHTKLTVKSPEKHSQQVRETYRDCFISEYVIGKVLYIQPLIRT